MNNSVTAALSCLCLAAGLGLGRYLLPAIPAGAGGKPVVVSSTTAAGGEGGDKAGNSAAKAPSGEVPAFSGNAEELLNLNTGMTAGQDSYYLFLHALQKASAGQLAQWAEEISHWTGERKSKADNEGLLSSIFDAWAAKDLDALLAWKNGKPPALQEKALAAAALRLADTNPERAMAVAREIPNKKARDGAVLSLVEGLAKSNLAAASRIIDEMWPASSSSNSEAGIALSYLLVGWVKTSPAEGLQLWLKNFPKRIDLDSSSTFFLEWMKHDMAGAMAAIQKHVPEDSLSEFKSNLLMRWAQSSPDGVTKGPQAALLWETHPEMVIDQLFKESPQAALAKLAEVPLKMRGEAITSLANSWAMQDWDAAAKWALSLPTKEKRSAFESIASQFDFTDVEKFKTFTQSLPEGADRDRITEQMFRNGVYQNPKALAECLVTQDLPTRQMLLRDGGLTTLAETSPELVLRASVDCPGADPYVVRRSFVSLAASNPALAEQLAQKWPSLVGGSALASVYAASIMQNGPGTVAKILSSLPQGEQSSALEEAFGTWAGKDPTALQAYAQTVTGEARKKALLALVKEKADYAAPEAAQLALQIMREGGGNTSDFSEVATNLCQDSPQAAVAWIKQIPPGDIHNAATAEIAQAWAHEDPAAASQWIHDLPAGPARNKAVEQLVQVIAPEDPRAALVWAGQLTDASRENALTTAFEEFVKHDPAAAREALKTTPMLEGTRLGLEVTLEEYGFGKGGQ